LHEAGERSAGELLVGRLRLARGLDIGRRGRGAGLGKCRPGKRDAEHGEGHRLHVRSSGLRPSPESQKRFGRGVSSLWQDACGSSERKIASAKSHRFARIDAYKVTDVTE